MLNIIYAAIDLHINTQENILGRIEHLIDVTEDQD
jgi:hypothetical protein